MIRTVEVRRWGRRSLSRRNRAGAWLAMLTCPCHGALVLYLAAGTAFGTALFAFRGWMYAGLAVAFVAGLWLMFRRDPGLAQSSPVPRSERHAVAPTSVGPGASRLAADSGPVRVRREPMRSAGRLQALLPADIRMRHRADPATAERHQQDACVARAARNTSGDHGGCVSKMTMFVCTRARSMLTPCTLASASASSRAFA